MKNLSKYKNDLNNLIEVGCDLLHAIQLECYPEKFRKSARKKFGAGATKFLENLPDFSEKYQAWYSESQVLVRQLIPDRVGDFIDYYQAPKVRKKITYENYRVSDYLLHLESTNAYGEKIVSPSAAIPKFRQQLSIVEAIRNRFESSLYEIKQLVQADLLDSDIEAARTLLKSGFLRSSGVMAGVVMERHLALCCENHGIKIRKSKPTIGDLNDRLKEADIIDLPSWRSNQYLGDIRNICVHKSLAEPTKEQVNDLLDGVAKLIKTLY